MNGNTHRLMSKALTTGESFDLDLNMIRAREGSMVNMALGLVVEVDVAMLAAATSDAIAQARWAKLVTNLQVLDLTGKPIPITPVPMEAAVVKELVSRVIQRGGGDEPASVAADSNTTNNRTLRIAIPFTLPHLKSWRDLLFPAAFIGRLRGTVPTFASPGFGTGHTITSMTINVNIAYLPIPAERLAANARLELRARNPSRHDQEPFEINGRLVALAVVDHNAGATTTIGATDISEIRVEGAQFNVPQQDVDVPTHVWNALGIPGHGDADDAPLELPSGGTARTVLLYAAALAAKISEFPDEAMPKVTITEGAGNPAEADHKLAAVVIKPRDEDWFAANLGLSKHFQPNADQVRQTLMLNDKVEGLNGPIDRAHRDAPYLPVRLALAKVA